MLFRSGRGHSVLEGCLRNADSAERSGLGCDLWEGDEGFIGDGRCQGIGTGRFNGEEVNGVWFGGRGGNLLLLLSSLFDAHNEAVEEAAAADAAKDGV